MQKLRVLHLVQLSQTWSNLVVDNAPTMYGNAICKSFVHLWALQDPGNANPALAATQHDKLFQTQTAFQILLKENKQLSYQNLAVQTSHAVTFLCLKFDKMLGLSNQYVISNGTQLGHPPRPSLETHHGEHARDAIERIDGWIPKPPRICSRTPSESPLLQTTNSTLKATCIE